MCQTIKHIIFHRHWQVYVFKQQTAKVLVLISGYCPTFSGILKTLLQNSKGFLHSRGVGDLRSISKLGRHGNFREIYTKETWEEMALCYREEEHGESPGGMMYLAPVSGISEVDGIEITTLIVTLPWLGREPQPHGAFDTTMPQHLNFCCTRSQRNRTLHTCWKSSMHHKLRTHQKPWLYSLYHASTICKENKKTSLPGSTLIN